MVESIGSRRESQTGHDHRKEKEMLNSKIYRTELTRLDVCDLLLATLNVRFDAMDEMNDPNTSADRKAILAGTVEKWKRLHDKLSAELERLDKENGF